MTLTVANILTLLTTVLSQLWTTITGALGTITGNPLLYVPVLIGLFGTFVMFAISIIRRFGVRGLGGGRRRRRR